MGQCLYNNGESRFRDAWTVDAHEIDDEHCTSDEYSSLKAEVKNYQKSCSKQENLDVTGIYASKESAYVGGYAVTKFTDGKRYCESYKKMRLCNSQLGYKPSRLHRVVDHAMCWDDDHIPQQVKDDYEKGYALEHPRRNPDLDIRRYHFFIPAKCVKS